MLTKTASALSRLTTLGTIALMAAIYVASAGIAGSAPVDTPLPQSAVAGASNTVWVIFIDDLHLDFRATGRIKDLFRTVVSQLIREGDLFAVVSTGPSSIAIDLTRDRRRLDSALTKISGAALKPSQLLAAPTGTYSPEIQYRAHLAVDTAYGILKTLAAVSNQPKAFIYVSNGYDFDLWAGGVPSSSTNPFLTKGNSFTVEHLREEVAELTAQAKRGNVTIYGIDPRALTGPPDVDPNVTEPEWQRYWTTTRNSLRVIAEDNSGFVIQDDLAGGLNRIATAMRQ